MCGISWYLYELSQTLWLGCYYRTRKRGSRRCDRAQIFPLNLAAHTCSAGCTHITGGHEQSTRDEGQPSEEGWSEWSRMGPGCSPDVGDERTEWIPGEGHAEWKLFQGVGGPRDRGPEKGGYAPKMTSLWPRERPGSRLQKGGLRQQNSEAPQLCRLLPCPLQGGPQVEPPATRPGSGWLGIEAGPELGWVVHAWRSGPPGKSGMDGWVHDGYNWEPRRCPHSQERAGHLPVSRLHAHRPRTDGWDTVVFVSTDQRFSLGIKQSVCWAFRTLKSTVSLKVLQPGARKDKHLQQAEEKLLYKPH